MRFGVSQNKKPLRWEGLFQDEGLGYVFALAGVWPFLTGLLAFLTALLLLTALFFLAPALFLRTVSLLTTLLLAALLAHTTLFTISFHVRLHFWGLHLVWVHNKESRL